MGKVEPTKEQQEAINSCCSSLHLNAGPGSGKSTTLAQTCSKILENINNRVILITFTNRGAREIIEKCSHEDQSRILGGTFHSLCHKTMKSNGMNYSICDENKKRLVIRRLFRHQYKDFLEEIYNEISQSKSNWPIKDNKYEKIYTQELRKFNLLDFDDLINIFLSSNVSFPPATHCLVDELQDTSTSQLEVLKKIYLQKCIMIGCSDIDQSIFEWRSSKPENVEEFIKIFNCKQVDLSINFRSDKNIVKYSRNLIEHNKKRQPKDLKAHSIKDGEVQTKGFENFFDEIDFIASLCDSTPTKILYRNRAFKYHLEFELKKRGIKYKVNDFLDITDKSYIKVVMACLKISTGNFDLYDIEQASKALKGIGKKTTDSLSSSKDLAVSILNFKPASRVTSLKTLFQIYNDHIGSLIPDIIDLIEDLFIDSYEVSSDIQKFFKEMTSDIHLAKNDIKELSDLLGLGDKKEETDENSKIELSTIHGAKGTEAEKVIIAFSNLFDPQPNKEYNEEAERRLFYVGMTRAKNELWITYSGNKPRFVIETKI